VFALPRLTSSVDDVMRVLTTLRSLASVSLSTAPIAVQIFEGATHTR
jgi:hypothetical protein